jgi:hypothetical protein
MENNYKVHTHVWNYGNYETLEQAERIAKMVMEEEHKTEMFITDVRTNEIIKTITA